MAVSSLAHEQYFQLQREKQLPSLVPFFRRIDGVENWQHVTPHLYPTQGILNLREAPVSGEAFKYWMTAFVQRLSGEASERDLRFMRPQTKYYPGDDEGLAEFALPLTIADPALLARQMARFRKVYEVEGVASLRKLAESLWDATEGTAAGSIPRGSYSAEADREVAATLASALGEISEADRSAAMEAAAAYAGDLDDAGRDMRLLGYDDLARQSARVTRSGDSGSQMQWVNAYIVLQMSDALRRRYRFIKSQRVDIIEDCVRFSAFDSYYTAKPEMQVDFSGDIFVRMGHDVRSLGDGVRKKDWSWLRRSRAYVHLPLAEAFRERRAVVDLVLNNSLVEIKPVRTMMVPGASDQLLAYSLLYKFHHPEHTINELRFYLARHATWIVASLPEIYSRFPVRAFAELLWSTTESFLVRGQRVDFDRFCHRQAHVAGINAWRMEDQIHSAQRRYERAGRIGVNRIAAQKEVPHAIAEVIQNPENQDLPPRIQRASEALELEKVWRSRYEQWQTRLREDYAAMGYYREAWREFVERL